MFEKIKSFFRRNKGGDEFMINMQNDIRQLNDLVREGLDYTNEEYIIYLINKFKNSPKRALMVAGEKYYEGKHDILFAKRMGIGENGEPEEIKYLPNNHIVDNQYKKMVDQKNNYLLGKPFSIKCDNGATVTNLKPVLNKKFKRQLKNIGQGALNQGLNWLYCYYDKKGNWKFKRFDGYEIIPDWKDSEHSELNFAIRIYEVLLVNKSKEKTIEKVELYTPKGVFYYILNGNKLIPDVKKFENYFTITTKKDNEEVEESYNWEKIPLIPFRYNNKEIPLLNNIKSLQDGINTILSTFENNMEEDSYNTILILLNYGGENLAEFRRNLIAYRAVKVETDPESKIAGDLRTLQIEVNSENYKAILEIFKKALIENAMGYDAKDDRLGGNANQLNIKSMYSDIDLDANNMETEFQAAFEELLEFISYYLSQTGQGEFNIEAVDIIFDRDMLMDESSIITNIQNSTDLSLKTRVENHPWVSDPELEMQRIKEEKQEMIEQYPNSFNHNPDDEEDDEVDEE